MSSAVRPAVVPPATVRLSPTTDPLARQYSRRSSRRSEGRYALQNGNPVTVDLVPSALAGADMTGWGERIRGTPPFGVTLSPGSGRLARVWDDGLALLETVSDGPYGGLMERQPNPASSPIFFVGIIVIVLIAQAVTAGIENFWWHLVVMAFVSLILAWPLRLIMKASDRRLERKMQDDARPRG